MALALPKLFVGATPFLIGFDRAGDRGGDSAGAERKLAGSGLDGAGDLRGGAAVVLLIAFFVMTRMMARKAVVAVVTPLRRALDAGRIASENLMSKATMEHDLTPVQSQAAEQERASGGARPGRADFG